MLYGKQVSTFRAKPNTTVTWCELDAKDQILGRFAKKVAVILMGKDKPTQTPGVDPKMGVVVLNANRIKITGKNKPEEKLYKRYSGYPGGLKTRSFKEVFQVKPEYVIFHAVCGMLPKNKLVSLMQKRLRVYKGTSPNKKA